MMTGGFDRYKEKIEASNKSLASELDVHVFGPYTGLCSHILEELTYQLRKSGFDGAHTCAEIDDPPLPPDISNPEKNWIRSKDCLERADVAVFIFLEARENRTFTPGQAVDINTSVAGELVYWSTSLNRHSNRTFVVYEGNAKDDIGSPIVGVVENLAYESVDVDSCDYPEIFEQVSAQCWNWVNRFC